jgi:hypothetical protein
MEAGLSIVKRLEGEILGPESSFVILRGEQRKEWEPIVAATAAIEVKDSIGHETAVQHGRLLQVAGKNLEELYKPIKQDIDAVKKIVLEAEKADLGAVNAAKTELAAKVQAYAKEQERIRLEKAREEAAAARKAAEEQRLQDAIAAEEAGEKAEAEQILNEVVMPAPSIVQVPQVKAAGQVTKTTYSAQVTNLMQLVKAVAAGTVPLQALKADEPFLNSQARAFRQGLNYPGIVVKENTSTHFRA